MFAIDSDESLIKKAQKGSQRSWVKLVKRHEKRVYNYCLRMTLNEADARELMQEIFLAVYRNSPNYKARGKFSHWILGVASNKTIDFLRGQKRNPLFNAETINEENITIGGEDYDDLTMIHDNNRIFEAMSRLPADQKLMVELKFFQQMTFDEISTHAGIPESTAKTRLYAALRKLKDYLEFKNAV